MPTEIRLYFGQGPNKGSEIELKTGSSTINMDIYRFHRLIEGSVLHGLDVNKKGLEQRTNDEIVSYARTFRRLPKDRKQLNAVKFTTGFDNDPAYPRKTSLAQLRRMVNDRAKKLGLMDLVNLNLV